MGLVSPVTSRVGVLPDIDRGIDRDMGQVHVLRVVTGRPVGVPTDRRIIGRRITGVGAGTIPTGPIIRILTGLLCLGRPGIRWAFLPRRLRLRP